MGSIINGKPAIARAPVDESPPARRPDARSPVDAPSTGHVPNARVRVGSRRPGTQVLLGRLRTELGRIPAFPASAIQAHAEVVQAMVRARLGGWSLPGLDDVVAHRHADGTVTIPLASHLLIINPWGAFRIVDCLRPAVPYCELNGADGRAFSMPADRPASGRSDCRVK